jgi:DNA-binding HxlR family transcriptional regulator
MSAPESDEPIETSCNESGSWAALRRSDSPAVSDDPTVTREDPLGKIEGRWTLQILLCLNGGEHRFSDLRAAIPRLSPNILTDRLRALECAGLVERHHLQPPYASQVYMLADVAAGLRPALDALARWRAETCDAPLPAQNTGFDQGLGMEQSR